MPNCKTCGAPIEWGSDGERWVPLIPAGQEGEAARTHVDVDGGYRASHFQICKGKSSVFVTRLQRPLPAALFPPPKRRKKKDLS